METQWKKYQTVEFDNKPIQRPVMILCTSSWKSSWKPQAQLPVDLNRGGVEEWMFLTSAVKRLERIGLSEQQRIKGTS